MKKHVIYYDLVTGEILHTGYGTDIEIQAAETEDMGNMGFLEGVGESSKHYINVNTVEVVNKTSLPILIDKLIIAADGEESITISNIPIGTVITLDEEVYTVNDGIFELTFDLPKKYGLTLKHPKYYKRRGTLEGTY